MKINDEKRNVYTHCLLMSSYIAIFSNGIVSTTASTTVTLNPIADAFVQSDFSDDNYGATSLYCTFLENSPLLMMIEETCLSCLIYQASRQVLL